MRRILLIAALCLLTAASTGCKKAQLRRQLKELMGSTIVLPEKITCVYNGEVYPMPDSLREKAKLIVYLDSTECASCRISHLESYHQLFHLSEETGLFEVVVLLSNTELYGMSILRYVSDQMLEHPIYCDVENKFLRLNPSIPKTALSFHSFLVDHVGVPVCVGDPSMSETMYLIFLKSINKLVK